MSPREYQVPKFRKKPVVINAFQWTGENPFHLGVWIAEGNKDPDRTRIPPNSIVGPEDARCVQIHTLEGVMLASPGDWIIQGVKGELYPCKPDIFAATYEPADSPSIVIASHIGTLNM